MDGAAALVRNVVTNAHVIVTGYQEADQPHRLSLAKGDSARLLGDQRLALDVTEQYRVQRTDDGWCVQVVGYLYAIDHEGRELVAYHWHPHGNSQITAPHMHVRADVRVGDRWLGKVHLPTKAIDLEDVVALAIEELGAEPLREDWKLLLHESRPSGWEP
jgi:hypothetical protein